MNSSEPHAAWITGKDNFRMYKEVLLFIVGPWEGLVVYLIST